MDFQYSLRWTWAPDSYIQYQFSSGVVLLVQHCNTVPESIHDGFDNHVKHCTPVTKVFTLTLLMYIGQLPLSVSVVLSFGQEGQSDCNYCLALAWPHPHWMWPYQKSRLHYISKCVSWLGHCDTGWDVHASSIDD